MTTISDRSIKANDRTTVHVTTHRSSGDRLVMLECPTAPKGFRWTGAGRITDLDGTFGFQPAPLAAWLLGPEVLRAIADLTDLESPATTRED